MLIYILSMVDVHSGRGHFSDDRGHFFVFLPPERYFLPLSFFHTGSRAHVVTVNVSIFPLCFRSQCEVRVVIHALHLCDTSHPDRFKRLVKILPLVVITAAAIHLAPLNIDLV